jgi:hypothetical protein
MLSFFIGAHHYCLITSYCFGHSSAQVSCTA